MTKQELMERITVSFDRLPYPKIELAVNSILELMSQKLIDDERIEIRGFGSFHVRVQKARIVRNPMTGALLPNGAKPKVHFKPGKELRERVNGGSYEKITY